MNPPMLKKFLIFALAAFLTSGCLATRIMESNERQALGDLNLKREQAGLAPLTWHQYHDHGMGHPEP